MNISLIIPIYNEGKIIENTIKKLKVFLDNEKEGWEILFVNDGSTDNTLKIIKNFTPKFFKVISYERNRGKGFAIRVGVEKALGDYICFIDSDLAYSFNNLKELISKLENCDAVFGSRDMEANNFENISLLRRIFGKSFNLFSNIILGYKAEDTQCGLKVFKREMAREIFSKQILNRWAFDTEVFYIAKKKNYKIKRVKAILSKNNLSKKSKVNLLKDPLKMFFDLFKIKLNDLFRKYE